MEHSNADRSIIKIFLDSENISGMTSDGKYIFDISKDITSINPDSILSTYVLKTIVGGKEVFKYKNK